MTDPGVIRVAQHIAHPPSRVWAAVSEPALLERWWASGDIRPVIGHRFALDMGGFGAQECEVRAVDPGRMISYSFGEGMLDTVITWTVEAEGDGTLLSLEHAGFDMDSEMGRQAHQGMSAGWPQILRGIEPALAEGSSA